MKTPASRKPTPNPTRNLVGKKRSERATKSQNTQEPDFADKGKWSRRQFPQNTLHDAFSIPQVIKEKTTGNPCDTELVAKALDLSRQGPKFYYLCASARDYGLTIGSRDTAQIALDRAP
jgi:hypothetical protein